MAIDRTKAAVSRDEIIRKNGKLEKVKAGTGAKSDDVLMGTSEDFAVLGNTYDPEWGVQYKSLGDTLMKTYKKEYLTNDAIGHKTQELNDQNMNNYFDQFLQRQQQVNEATGKGDQKYQDVDNTIVKQAYGGKVPRYDYGGSPWHFAELGGGIGGMGAGIPLMAVNKFRRANPTLAMGLGLPLTVLGAGATIDGIRRIHNQLAQDKKKYYTDMTGFENEEMARQFYKDGVQWATDPKVRELNGEPWQNEIARRITGIKKIWPQIHADYENGLLNDTPNPFPGTLPAATANFHDKNITGGTSSDISSGSGLACGGEVDRYADGGYYEDGYVPSYAEGSNIGDIAGENTVAAKDLTLNDVANGVSEGNVNTEFAILDKMGLGDLYKGRMIAEMGGKKMLDFGKAMGALDQKVPGEIPGHLMSAALNPYSSVALGALHSHIPSMDPEEAQIHELWRNANMNASAANSPGARAMLMADANAQYNDMLQGAQKQHDALMMEQGKDYANMAATLGHDDMNAMNTANQYNAEEQNVNEQDNWKIRERQNEAEVRNIVNRVQGMGSSMGWAQGDKKTMDQFTKLKGEAKNIVDKIIQKTIHKYAPGTSGDPDEISAKERFEESLKKMGGNPFEFSQTGAYPTQEGAQDRPLTDEERAGFQQTINKNTGKDDFQELLNKWWQETQSPKPTDKAGAAAKSQYILPEKAEELLRDLEAQYPKGYHKDPKMNAQRIIEELDARNVPIDMDVMAAFDYVPDGAGGWKYKNPAGHTTKDVVKKIRKATKT